MAGGLIIAIILVANRNALSDDNFAEECLQGEDDGVIIDCLDEKSFEYYNNGDCEKALKVYDDVPVDLFDKNTLANIYDEAYSLSLDCNDESLRLYWENKSESIWSQLEGVQ